MSKSKKKLKLLLAFDVPAPLLPHEAYEQAMHTEASWSTEAHLCQTLRDNGHEVLLAPLTGNPRELIDRVEEVRPDVVWNSVETIRNQRYYESHVVALLELLGVPYTGCGLGSILLCKDKDLSKKLLKHHRIGVPGFTVSRLGRVLRLVPPELLPAFVKPLSGEGSEGIARDSFAETSEQALERVNFLHERRGCDVIVERFVAGREIYVGVMGLKSPKVLPPRELRFTKVPEGEPTFASYKAKWDPGYRERWGIENGFAEDLPDSVLDEIRRTAKRVFRILHLRGYARLDIRLAPDGALFVVEVNPNPEIARGEDFAEAAARAGIAYPDLLERIVRMALAVRLP